jgi:predicted amidohydrolase
MDSFKLAMVQMRVVGGDKPGNLARAARLIDEAAAAGATAVLLPEVLDCGWTHPSATELAERIPDGLACRMLSGAAARHGVVVCAGITERDGERIYNAAVLFDADGALRLVHRKANELEIAHGMYAPGDRLGVARTAIGNTGVMICADATATGNVLTRAVGYLGADIILSPAAWAVEASHDNVSDPYGKTWRDSYGPVAKDFRLWIAGVSNVGPIDAGPWAGRKCIGCSLLVGPDGQPVLEGPYGEDAETILYATVRPVARPTWGCGWYDVWAKDRGEL